MIKIFIPLIIIGTIVILNIGVPFGTSVSLKATEDKILKHEYVITKHTNMEAEHPKDWFEEQKEYVTYKYISTEEVPIEKGEDISKRTFNTKFFKLKGDEWQAKIAPDDTYYKDGNKWYDVKTATTTLSDWNKQVTGKKITFIEKVLAASDTFNPHTNDGEVKSSGYGNSYLQWIYEHEHSVADTVDKTDDDSILGTYNAYGGGVYYAGIWRNVLSFDTSSLPTNITVSAATIKVRCMTLTGNANGLNAKITTMTPDSATDLIAADYKTSEYPTPISSAVTVDTINTYYTFTLDATGRTWIEDHTDTYSSFGIRESDYDIPQTMPNPWLGYNETLSLATQNHATSAYRPLLTVTYTVLASRRIIIVN